MHGMYSNVVYYNYKQDSKLGGPKLVYSICQRFHRHVRKFKLSNIGASKQAIRNVLNL